MNHLNLQRNERLRNLLAAEYVLGTLRHGARRRFEHWLAVDPALRTSLAEWEQRLLPLAELAQPAPPPAAVWDAISLRLGIGASRTSAVARPSRWRMWFDSVAFWRNCAIGTAALASVLVAVLVTGLPRDGGPPVNYVAALADDKARTMVMVTADAARRTLAVRFVQPQNFAADRSLELWALPAEGPPRSLGLLPGNAPLVLNEPGRAALDNADALAVSLEPKGGSSNPNAPSGPVLFKGAWIRM